MVNVMDIVKDMQRGCVVKMDEDIKERIEEYQKTALSLEWEKAHKDDEKEIEAIEYRIERIRALIDHLYEKDNPTKKKEMYK